MPGCLMSRFPSLPLFTDALVADTDHLSDAEFGAYLRLLILMWRTPECRVPADKAWLARRLRKTAEQIGKEVWPLVQEFCKSDGNFIFQGRLQDEFVYLREQSKRQTERAH